MLSSFVLMSRILCCELWRNTLSASFAFSHLERTMAANECSVFTSHTQEHWLRQGGIASIPDDYCFSSLCPSTDLGDWGQMNLTAAGTRGSGATVLQLCRELALTAHETSTWFAFVQ